MAGTTAAVDLIASLGEGEDRRARLRTAFAAIEAHEDALRERLEAGLAMLPLTVHSRAKRRTPTVLVTFDDVVAADVSVALAGRDINAPSSNFYAWEASHRLGLGEDGGLRVGLAPYSTEDDIDRLLTALGEILSV
jgi:selenocysteine lyase/cysteine desulfurase